MSRKVLFDSRFWSDPWVIDHLSIVERHLFFYLFSNEHANIAGVYEISLRTISNETGFEREEIIRMLKRLEPKVKYIDGWIVMRNAIKNQNYKSSDTKTGIMRIIAACPEDLVAYINWPNDFGEERPRGSAQMKFIEADIEQLFGSEGVEKKTIIEKNDDDKKSTSQGVGGGLSAAGGNSTVPIVNCTNKTTVGNKKKNTTGKNFEEANFLFDDLPDLVNEKYREWYCKLFHKFGHAKVLLLASQARADGKDPKKLFSKLLKDEQMKAIGTASEIPENVEQIFGGG